MDLGRTAAKLVPLSGNVGNRTMTGTKLEWRYSSTRTRISEIQEEILGKSTFGNNWTQKL